MLMKRRLACSASIFHAMDGLYRFTHEIDTSFLSCSAMSQCSENISIFLVQCIISSLKYDLCERQCWRRGARVEWGCIGHHSHIIGRGSSEPGRTESILRIFVTRVFDKHSLRQIKEELMRLIILNLFSKQIAKTYTIK